MFMLNIFGRILCILNLPLIIERTFILPLSPLTGMDTLSCGGGASTGRDFW